MSEAATLVKVGLKGVNEVATLVKIGLKGANEANEVATPVKVNSERHRKERHARPTPIEGLVKKNLEG